MTTKRLLSAALGLLALGLVATAADAAPVTGLAGATAETSGANLVEKAHWYRRYHYRPYYYRHYYPRYYGHYYYPRYHYPRRHYYRYHW
jgi:hypothetical protein